MLAEVVMAMLCYGAAGWGVGRCFGIARNGIENDVKEVDRDSYWDVGVRCIVGFGFAGSCVFLLEGYCVLSAVLLSCPGLVVSTAFSSSSSYMFLWCYLAISVLVVDIVGLGGFGDDGGYIVKFEREDLHRFRVKSWYGVLEEPNVMRSKEGESSRLIGDVVVVSSRVGLSNLWKDVLGVGFVDGGRVFIEKFAGEIILPHDANAV
ncbi:hypothetical protein Tco_1227922 [Tanacetum coccineum]